MININDLPDFNKIFIPDFDNGKLYWAKGTHLAGKEAGSIRDRRGGNGKHEKLYCMIQYKDFTNYSRAKILYYMRYAIWVPMIDHINGNSADDRIVNLREITPSKNVYNCQFRKKDKLLPIGVSIDKSVKGEKIYQAQYTMFGKKYKKRFYTPEEAHRHYLNAMASYYGKEDNVDYYFIKQRSAEWHLLRKNRWTGSRAIKLLQGKPLPDDSSTYQNNAMKRGQFLESIAIREFKVKYGSGVVDNVGAVINSKYPNALYSPDAIFGDTLLEVKCLNGVRHENIITGDIPLEYQAQIYFGMLICDLKKAKLLAFNPEYEQQLTIIDVPYDEKIIENIRNKLVRNNTEVL